MNNKKQIENLNKQVKQLTVKDTKKDESFEEYTAKELEYLDKYHAYTDNKLDDEELYEIIIKHDFEDNSIKRELNEYLKLVNKKGEEYGWQQVVKGKSKTINSRSQA